VVGNIENQRIVAVNGADKFVEIHHIDTNDNLILLTLVRFKVGRVQGNVDEDRVGLIHVHNTDPIWREDNVGLNKDILESGHQGLEGGDLDGLDCQDICLVGCTHDFPVIYAQTLSGFVEFYARRHTPHFFHILHIMSGKHHIGIFSGSRFPIDDGVKSQLTGDLLEIARTMNPTKHTVVYGGGDSGLMSVIPKEFDARGGEVVGIDARMFVEKYGSAPFGQQYVEETFDARQKRLIETADVFLALPGGVGTVYEVMEVMTYNDLKLWNRDPERVRRIIVFNHSGAYDGLKRHIQEAVEAGYVVASSAEAVVWCDTVAEVVGWTNDLYT